MSRNFDNAVAKVRTFKGPNYSGWPLAFLQSGRSIPFKYRKALANELKRTNNIPYVNNLKKKLDEAGFEWKGLL